MVVNYFAILFGVATCMFSPVFPAGLDCWACDVDTILGTCDSAETVLTYPHWLCAWHYPTDLGGTWVPNSRFTSWNLRSLLNTLHEWNLNIVTHCKMQKRRNVMYHYFSTQRLVRATGNELFFFVFLWVLGGDVNVPVNLLTSCMLWRHSLTEKKSLAPL